MCDIHQEHVGFGIIYVFCSQFLPWYADVLSQTDIRKSKMAHKTGNSKPPVRNNIFEKFQWLYLHFWGRPIQRTYVRHIQIMITVKNKMALVNRKQKQLLASDRNKIFVKFQRLLLYFRGRPIQRMYTQRKQTMITGKNKIALVDRKQKYLLIGITYMRNSSGYIYIFEGAPSKGRMSDTYS